MTNIKVTTKDQIKRDNSFSNDINSGYETLKDAKLNNGSYLSQTFQKVLVKFCLT